MTTQKQIEANRENAKLGGVRTEEGKAVSKYNALKHGLLSKEVLLEGEDEKTLIEIGKKLRAELKPETELELLLADRIVANTWRLKRTLEVEKSAMDYKREDEMRNEWNVKYLSEEQRYRKAMQEMIVNDDIEKITRYETTIERGIYKALHELQRLQAARAGEKPPLPVAIDVDINTEK
jgi:hypothetical protein